MTNPSAVKLPQPKTYCTRWGMLCVVIVIAVVGVLLVAVYGLLESRSKGSVEKLPQNTVNMLQAVRADAPMLGNPQAKLTIVEFGDFLCPVCQKNFSIMRELVAKHPQEVALYWRHYPIIDLQSVDFAIASECAHDQGKFWAMHDRLFQQQDALDVSQLANVARQVGLDEVLFKTCFDSGKDKQVVQDDFLFAQDELQAKGTPTFVVNGYMVSGFVPLQTWEQILAETSTP